MTVKVSFDTNIFVYTARIAASKRDLEKSEAAAALILFHSGAGDELFVAAQVLVELFDVLVRKGRYDRAEAGIELDRWRSELNVVATNEKVIEQASTLATRHKLRIFDAVILAAAADAQCDILYSEDLQHGFVWRGVEVANPFL